MEASIILDEVVDAISKKNPIHGKKLAASLSGLDEMYYEKAQSFFRNYISFASKSGDDLAYGVESYLGMIQGMMNEYIYFEREKEYRCKSFSEACSAVYDNAEVMKPYMHGLLLSQFLWNHHYEMLEYYSSNIGHVAKDTKHYLEVGGGHGLFLREAISKISGECNYTMVDISKSSLDMAKVFASGLNVDYVHSDIFQYEPTHEFDFITMGEVLEHVEEPGKLLQRLGALLAEDGRIFITTPTNAPAIDHIYLFRNEAEIEQLIRDSGFDIIQSKGVFSEKVSKEEGERKSVAMLYGAFLTKSSKH